jgi:energy-converting hydrogenase B subunit Q
VSDSESPPASALSETAFLVNAPDEPGIMHRLTGVIFDHRANITYVDITARAQGKTAIYFELESVANVAQLLVDLRQLPIVEALEEAPSFRKIYGKRIIVIGGGAQVGQVVIGAVSEADRHNIRGERISVDTIPLVGEENLAAAVRAVGRLPRAVALILAGALMGGEISAAAEELRAVGIPIIALNMVGSITDHVDLVISDPVQAGTMAVMAVADTATLDLARLRGRRY